MKRLALIFALASCAFAQNAFRSDPSPIVTGSGVVPPLGYPALYAVPGAPVTVWTSPAMTTPATTYTDGTAGTACPQTSQIVEPGQICVATAGPLGQFGWWLSTGSYWYSFQIGGVLYGPFPITVGGGGSAPSGNQPVPVSSFGGTTVAQQMTNCVSPTWSIVLQSQSGDLSWPTLTQNGCIFDDLRGPGSFTGEYPGGYSIGQRAGFNGYQEKTSTDTAANQYVYTGWSRGLLVLNGGQNTVGAGNFKSFNTADSINLVSNTNGENFGLKVQTLNGSFGDNGGIFISADNFGSNGAPSGAPGDDGQAIVDGNAYQCVITGATHSLCDFSATISTISGNQINYPTPTSVSEDSRGQRYLIDTTTGVCTLQVNSINYPTQPPVVTLNSSVSACGLPTGSTPTNLFFAIPNVQGTDLAYSAETSQVSAASADNGHGFTTADIPPTVLYLTGSCSSGSVTAGWYRVTNAASGHVFVDHAPSTADASGCTYIYGGNTYGGAPGSVGTEPMFVTQIRSISSNGLQLTLNAQSQGADTTWFGHAMTGLGYIYRGSTVTSLCPTGCLNVVDGSQFNPGDTFVMPIGAGVRVSGFRGYTSSAVPTYFNWPLNINNGSYEPASSMVTLGGYHLYTMQLLRNPLQRGLSFAVGVSPLNCYFCTFDNVPNSNAILMLANMNSGTASISACKSCAGGAGAIEVTGNLQVTGNFINGGGLIDLIPSGSPYTLTSGGHYACNPTTSNITVYLPSLAVATAGGDGQNVIITLGGGGGNNVCTINVSTIGGGTTPDKILWGTAGVGHALTSWTIGPARGDTFSVLGSVIAAGNAWIPNIPLNPMGGPEFTVSGCSAVTSIGGSAFAGSFVLGAVGPCNVIITPAGATGYIAPNAWTCSGQLLAGGLVVVGVTSGGSGYLVNDILGLTELGASGGVVTVATVTGSAVATVSVTDSGNGYTPGAAGVPSYNISSSGSGATFTMTTLKPGVILPLAAFNHTTATVQVPTGAQIGDTASFSCTPN